MIERELKRIIHFDTYKSIWCVFNWDVVKTQINYYYDVFPFEKSKKMTIRIRSVDNLYKLQIKSACQNSYIEKIEFEEKVPRVFPFISSEKIRAVSGLHYDDVFLIGALVTKRHIHQWSDSITICLDKNEYLGTIDYELEIEYEKDVTSELLTLLSEHGIRFDDEKQIGKYSRYMKRCYSMRGNIEVDCNQ